MDGNQGGEQGTLPAASTHLGSYTGFLSLHRIRDKPTAWVKLKFAAMNLKKFAIHKWMLSLFFRIFSCNKPHCGVAMWLI